jgi:hypothetical protein
MPDPIQPINLSNIDVTGTNKFNIASGYQGLSIDPTKITGNLKGLTSVNLPAASSAKGLNFLQKAGSAASTAAKEDPGAFGQIAQGLAGIAGGIIGGGARRREQRAARTELADQRRAYEQFEFQDPTANMTNPFEDLTVNQQAAQFSAQQQQQALAGTLSGLQGAAGSSGIGALAQAIAQQQQQGFQASAADIGRQEQQNQLMRARGQQQLEQSRSRGAQYVQEREFGRTEDLFSIAASRKLAADEARKQATEGLIGGVGNLVVGAGRVAAAAATGGASEAVAGGL